ncbi:MAG: hypothetical protein ACE5MG_02115 [Candidatus Methylomirabilales bacterium]
MSKFRRIGLLLLLCVAIPGRAETAGFHEVRDAVDQWHRVFGELPALEQFVRDGRRPRHQYIPALEETVEVLSQQEAANPFLPLARGALFTITKRGSVQAEAGKASHLAGDRVAVRWLLHTAFLGLGEAEAADHELRQIREIRDRLGLDRIAYLGLHLAHSAEALAARGKHEEAEKALAVAAEFDPDTPAVFFARARILLDRGSPQGVLPLVKGWWISLTSPFYGLGLWANILASILFAVPMILLLVGLVLLVRVTPLFGHDLAEWRRKRLSPGTQASLPLPVYVLPLILGFGLFPSVLLCLLPLGIYLKARERLLWGGLILSLVLLPTGYHLLARMITTTTSPRYVALVGIEEGNRSRDTEATLLQWVEATPRNPTPWFYLGRVHRLRGELDQGVAAYSRIQTGGVQEAAAWTNRGNLAFLAGDLPHAQTAYQKAVAFSPNLSYARFNLSQLLTERLLLEEAQQEYVRAIRENPALEGRMKQAVADGRKRVMVDAPLAVTVLWPQMFLLDSPSRKMAEVLWGGRFLGISLANLPWAAGAYLMAFGGIFWVRGRRRFARACEECGKVFCPRCQRLLGEIRLCTRCAIIEKVRGGEMPRSIKAIPGDETRQEPKWVGWALRLIPGIEGLYRGRILWGFLLLTATLFAVSPILGAFLAPATYLPGASLPYQVSVSFLLLVCLYLVSAMTDSGSRKPAKGARWR